MVVTAVSQPSGSSTILRGDESGIGYHSLEDALTAYLERFLSIEVDIVCEEEN